MSCRKKALVLLAAQLEVLDFLVIPGGRIQAAHWSACAIAPPSGPCSSGSLSNAATHLPVSGSPRTRPLQHTKQTQSVLQEQEVSGGDEPGISLTFHLKVNQSIVKNSVLAGKKASANKRVLKPDCSRSSGSLCNGYVTDVVLQVPSEVSGHCSLPHRESNSPPLASQAPPLPTTPKKS